MNELKTVGSENAVLTAMYRQYEAARQTQDEIFEDCRLAFDRWCARLPKRTQALSELRREALERRDPAEIAKAWMRWSQGSMERLAEDARDQMELGAKVACHFTGSTLSISPSEAAANPWASPQSKPQKGKKRETEGVGA